MDLFFFPHLAHSRATTHVALFLNVQNASHLKRQIISAAPMEGEAGEAAREQVNYAFIDARFVSPFQVTPIKTTTEFRLQAVVICRPLSTNLSLRRLITSYEHELFTPKFSGI